MMKCFNFDTPNLTIQKINTLPKNQPTIDAVTAHAKKNDLRNFLRQ